MKKLFIIFSVTALCAVLFAGMAEAGTLSVTFVYNGVALDNAYVYLHTFPPQGGPIMQKNFRNAQYILGPTNASGSLSAGLPNGTWRVRLIRRASAPLGTAPANIYGPLMSGDYTWYTSGIINGTSGANLGTVSATIFKPGQPLGGQPITITGTVKGQSGTVLAGWAVKATTSPCYSIPRHTGSCPGPVYAAQALTDSNGNYAVKLQSAGTYYFYAYTSFSYAGACSQRCRYPGGYPTCTTTVGQYNSGSSYYFNCPKTVASPGLTGVNFSVPGY
ncbi:MAG: Ig-like domain-containing protein [Nitrospiraceae bacterium]|nr:Ig-like domain-containing protein [Nitrospiraceae bacterium]